MFLQNVAAAAVAVGAGLYLFRTRRLRAGAPPPPPPPLQQPAAQEWAAARGHDLWNLWVIGTLNVTHAAWWLGVVDDARWLTPLFALDLAYILADLVWLLARPDCVASRVRGTLLLHHAAILLAAPAAAGHPVLMRHLLRTWVVELHSWVHIAAREFSSPALHALNKPLFVVLRLVAFPLTWFVYARQRAALPPAVAGARMSIGRDLLCQWRGVHAAPRVVSCTLCP